MSRLSTYIIHVARPVAAILLSILFCGCSTLPERQEPPPTLSGIYFSAEEPGQAVEFEGNHYSYSTHGSDCQTREYNTRDSNFTVASCCRTILFTREGEILRDDSGTPWTREKPTNPADRLEHKPLTIALLDDSSGAPIPAFKYRYKIRTSSGPESPHFICWQDSQNTNGTIAINAPVSCQIDLYVDAFNYLTKGATHSLHPLTVRSDDALRRMTVRLKRGSVARGVIRDETTGDPIVGALVAPLYVILPGTGFDKEQSVNTDASGCFEVYFVKPRTGLHVSHRDYRFDLRNYYGDGIALANYNEAVKDRYEIEIKGKKIDTTRISGTVVDPSGQPICGVNVSAAYGHNTVTDTAGRFELLAAQRAIELHHPEYRWKYCELTNETVGVTVTMLPRPKVLGRVLNARGQPQRIFTVASYERSDFNYHTAGASLNYRTVTNDLGEFCLILDDPADCRIVVEAPGHALWENVVPATQQVSKAEVLLSEGTQVNGRVLFPMGHEERAVVKLSPHTYGIASSPRQSREDAAFDKFRRKRLTVNTDPDGSFHLTQVPPGTHRLRVDGRGISPVEYIVQIPREGRTVPHIRVKGTGCVKGRLYENFAGRRDPEFVPHPRAFTDATVGNSFKTIAFTTDEDGYFFVTNVPCGLVRVTVGNSQGDIGSQSTASANLNPGETTEIIVDGPPNAMGTAQTVELCFVVGGGSEAERRNIVDADDKSTVNKGPADNRTGFEINLKDSSGSFLVKDYFNHNPLYKTTRMAETNSKIEFRFIPKGVYTVYVDGLPNQKIQVPETNCSIRVHLPATRLKGRVSPADNRQSCINLFDAGKTNDVKYCWTSSTFDFRFIEPGAYILYAIDEEAGSFRRSILVDDGVHDAGTLIFTPGGTIKGKLRADWQKYEPDTRIVASDSQGISISQPIHHADGTPFEFKQLWPDLWTVKLVANNTTLMSNTVRIAGTETVTVDLVAPPIFLPL